LISTPSVAGVVVTVSLFGGGGGSKVDLSKNSLLSFLLYRFQARETDLRNSQEGVRDQIHVVKPSSHGPHRVNRCAG
jgi:hypothetical protein